MSKQSQILQIRLRPEELLEEHPSLRSYVEQGWRLVEAHAAYGIRNDIYVTVCLELNDGRNTPEAPSLSMFTAPPGGDTVFNCRPSQ